LQPEAVTIRDNCTLRLRTSIYTHFYWDRRKSHGGFKPVPIDNDVYFDGQAKAANELRKQGILVSSGGVRSIWLRHGVETFKKRLTALGKKLPKKVSYTLKLNRWP
jgi:hypothetical protein